MVVRCKVITALNQRFTHLKTILADQGFDGVDFLTTVKANYQLTIEVVCGVPGVKGFQVIPKQWTSKKSWRKN